MKRLHPAIADEYKLDELPALFSEMSQLMQNPYDHKQAWEFIDRHPWTLKYLSSGFSEANHLREFAEKKDFQITLQVPRDIETKYRERHGLAKAVRYETPLGNARQFVFIFEAVRLDIYRVLNR